MNYSKPFQKDLQILPARTLPLLCCPECSSVKASICKNCGTFICRNHTHEVHFHFCKKTISVEPFHDPDCKQMVVDAKQIAKEVVNLLLKNEPEKLSLAPNLNLKSSSELDCNIISEWKQKNPDLSNLPDSLRKKIIGLTSTQARYLYPNIRIYQKGDRIEENLDSERLNLICNDEEAGVILEVAGFF